MHRQKGVNGSVRFSLPQHRVHRNVRQANRAAPRAPTLRQRLQQLRAVQDKNSAADPARTAGHHLTPAVFGSGAAAERCFRRLETRLDQPYLPRLPPLAIPF
jgi:hypothetical protein